MSEVEKGRAVYTNRAANTLDCSEFEYLRKNKLYFDLKIIVQNYAEISVHRVVLATRFPILRRSLPTSANGEVYWTRFPKEIVEAALSYAYTGSMEINLGIAVRLFLFSYNIDCIQIRDWCVDFLSSRINLDNVGDIWSAANSTLNEELMNICLPTVQEHSEVLWKESHFCSVTLPEGMSIVLNDPGREASDEDESGKAEAAYRIKADALSNWIDNHKDAYNLNEQAYRFQRLLNIIDIETLPVDVALVIYGRARNFKTSGKRLMALEEVLRRPYIPKPIPCRSKFSPPTFFRKEYFVCTRKRNECVIQNIPELQSFTSLKQSVPCLEGSEVAFLQNWICVLGGSTNYMYTTTKYNTFSILDLEDKTKFEGPPMIHTRSHFSVVSTRYRIYSFGGKTGKSSTECCEMFDIKTSRWTGILPLSRACCETSAVVIPKQGILLVGDERLEFGRNAQLLHGDLEKDGPLELKWQNMPPMLSSRKRPGITYFDGLVYVAGGNLDGHCDVERLDVSSKRESQSQWTVVSLLKSPLLNPCSLFVFDGDLRILYGDGEIMEYSPHIKPNGDSPIMELWKKLTSMPHLAKSIILQREAQYVYPRWSIKS